MEQSRRCQYCAGLSIEALVELAQKEFSGNQFPKKHYYQHHASFADLEAAAAAGCDICQLILDCFKGSVLGSTDDGSIWPDRWTKSPTDDELTMYEEVTAAERSKIKLSINAQHPIDDENLRGDQVLDIIMVHVGPVYERIPTDDGAESVEEAETSSSITSEPAFDDLRLLLTTNEDLSPKIGGHPIGRIEIAQDLGSAAYHAIVRQWFDDCMRDHPSCWPKESPGLPTRVVDVGSPAGGSLDTVCVVENPSPGDKYAALSHCWGGRIEPVLLTNNLAEFKVAISYSSLPANFRDAITVTRNLGLRYLWIDSLCIIQDSKEDWEKESQKMGAVYRDAAVTIYAMSSKGSKEGILNKRPVVPAPPAVTLKISADAADKRTVAASMRVDSLDENLWRLSWNSPLSKRGWCLQEDVLSPRRFSYGSQGVYWQCPRGFQAWNGLPAGGVNLYPERLTHLNSILHEPALPAASPVATDRNAMLGQYYDLISSYSQRSLTVASDKLPAMAGIAAALAASLGKEGDAANYLAGIWDIDLANGLLWYPEMRWATHVPAYRAPSWSWACTDSNILFSFSEEAADRSLQWDLAILGGGVRLKNVAHRFGEVVDGALEVRGMTMPLVRSKQVFPRKLLDQKDVGFVQYDEPLDPEVDEPPAMPSLCRVADDELTWLMSASTTYLNEPSGEEDLAIDKGLLSEKNYKVLIVRMDAVPDSNVKRGQGLIVLKQDDSENFERVGCLRLIEITDDWLDEWESETLTIV